MGAPQVLIYSVAARGFPLDSGWRNQAFAARQSRVRLATMKVRGKSMRTIWLAPDGWSVGIIDQTRLPHAFETVTVTTSAQAGEAIRNMVVRGAPLIGAMAAYGIAL